MSFLEYVIPSGGAFFMLAYNDGKFKQRFYKIRKNFLDAVKTLLDDPPDYDVYYAPASFNNKKRKKEAVAFLKAFWVDIDCGEGKSYSDKIMAEAAIEAWFEERPDFPKYSALVDSGNGFHLYWFLDRDYSVEEWLPVAKSFKVYLLKEGLKFDPVRTADCVSVLRLPGTLNCKSFDFKQTTVLKLDEERVYSLYEIKDIVWDVGSCIESSDEYKEFHPSSPVDADTIAEHCAQMQYAKEIKCDHVPEPFWWGVLSILKFCENGDTLIHEWSKGDDRYDPEETSGKAERIQFPVRCTYFDALRPGVCLKCRNWKKIKSPITLGYRHDQTLGEDVPGFVVTNDSVYTEKNELVAMRPYWISNVGFLFAGKYQGDCHVTVKFIDYQGRERSEIVNTNKFANITAFKAWCQERNLVGIVNERQFLNYLIRSKDVWCRKHKETVMPATLGWYDNYELFVLGSHGVTANDVVNVDIGTEYLQLPKFTYDSAKKDEWFDVAQRIFNFAPVEHAFVLLAGFAAPMLALVDASCPVLLLSGRTGVGKTLITDFLLSAYVPFKRFHARWVDTVKSLFYRAGLCKNIPFVVDEVHDVENETLNQFIMEFSEGRERGRLTKDIQLRQPTEWCTIAFLTTNQSFFNDEGFSVRQEQLRRFIELPFYHPLHKELIYSMAKVMRECYGHACIPYLQLIIKDKENVIKKIDKAIKEIEVFEWLHKFGHGALHYLFACAFVAGEYLIKLGLALNPEDIIRGVLRLFNSEYRDNLEFIYDDDELVKYLTEEFKLFLISNKDNAVYWPRYGDPIRVSVKDRVVYRFDDENLWVVQKEVTKFLRSFKNLSREKRRIWLKAMGFYNNPVMMAVSPFDTEGRLAARVKVYHMELRKLGIKFDEELKKCVGL